MTEPTIRPATAADVPAILALVDACTGDGLDADGVAADLGRPALDLARDTLLGHDPSGALVAWGWVHLGRRARVDVHPDHRGRGLGTRLLGFTEARARELGSQRLGQNVPDANHAAAALLRGHGYEPLATSWLLEIATAAEPVPPDQPPGGVAIRPFRPGDGPAVHRLIGDAFGEWQKRPRPYDEWARLTVERPTFAPAVSPLAFHGDDLVGAVLSLDVPRAGDGYVDEVAVRADHRSRGIARVLLRHAFHAFHEHGRRTCVLWTHSDTEALAFYQRLGMTVRDTSTHYSRALSAAEFVR